VDDRWHHSGHAAVALLLVLSLWSPAVTSASGPPSAVIESLASLPVFELQGIACPSSTQCTAVEREGKEATFNPISPSTPTVAKIDAAASELAGIACPSSTQCTAVGDGSEATFNPTAAGNPTPVPVNAGIRLWGVACPSRTQCTAVGDNGYELTFNPTAPGRPPQITIDGLRELLGIACPSRTQCTAVTVEAEEVTFNPLVPGTPAPATVDPNTREGDPRRVSLQSVACPSGTQCTAVDERGREVTFNPSSPHSPTSTPFDHGPDEHNGVACTSGTQCTAIVGGAYEVTFDPTSPATPAPLLLEPTPNPMPFPPDRAPGRLVSVACPSSSQCTAVTNTGQEVTFNPNPASTRSKAGHLWTQAKCNRAYKTWARKRHHATRPQRNAEVNVLHRQHGCRVVHP
jgi:hypothetical protein